MANGASSSGSLPLFWDLASNDENKRLGSSSKLVSTLFNQQTSLPSTSRTTLEAEHTLEISPDVDAEQLQIQARAVEAKLDTLLAAEVSYSLRRLTRGLASPREQSRLGFSVALTELLSRIDVLTGSDVLVLILKHSTPEGKVSRSEEKNLHFARLFGLQALVGSGVLFRSDASANDATRAITILVELGEKRAPLKESIGWVLVQLLNGVTSAASPAPKQVQQAVIEALSGYATSGDLSPEKLAVLLTLSQVKKLDVGIPSLKNRDILSRDNLQVLSKLLRNAPSAETLADNSEEAQEATSKASSSKKGAQTGAFNPRVHFVWDIILNAYYGTQLAPAASQAPFPELYMACVDESMFANTASSERKSWGFQVFSKALPIVPSADKPLLFTPNFMRTWINQLASKDRMLHKAATSAAAVVQETVSKDPRTAFALTSQLMGKHGSHNFDRLTNTKTIESILSSMDTAGVVEYAQYIVQIIATSAEDSKRRWGLDQLLVLVRNTAIPTDDTVTEAILRYLIAGGFFSWKKATASEALLAQQPKPAFSDSIRALSRSRFLSCLTELAERTISVSDSTGKTRRVQGVTQGGQLWIARAWDIFTSLSEDTKTFSTVVDETALQSAKSGSQLLAKVRKASASTKDANQKSRFAAFESLLLASLLYVVDSSEDASELIEPLEDCYASLFEEKIARTTDESEEDGEEPSGIELLQDYLIGLLERPSAFLRAIAEQSFGVFVAEMNEESVDHLVDQLGLSEEPEDEGKNSEEGDEEEEEEEEEEDEEAESSDTSSDSGDTDSEDDGDEDGDDEEEVDLELRKDVLEALRSVGMAEEEDSEGADEGKDASDADSDADEVDSLPDFTDEQMLQVDDRLAEIFRSRVNTKKNDKEAKQDSIAFQNKILDLLAIFAKKRNADSLVLRLVRPLFVIATEGESLDKQVSTKATNILRNNICKAKDVPTGVSFSVIADDFMAVHTFAQRSSSGELSTLANTVNLYLTRVASGQASNEEPLIAQYKSTLTDFLTRKASLLKPQFLLDAFKKFAVVGWALRGQLLESCSPKGAAAASIKSFRQQQALQMVSTILNQVVTSTPAGIERSDILTTMEDTAELVFSTVSDAVASPSANATTVKETLKLGLQAARLTKRLLSSGESKPEQLRHVWKPAKIQEASASLSSSDRFKQATSLNGLLKQMAAIVDDKSGNDKKRKSEGGSKGAQNGDHAAAGESKKAKKTSSTSSPGSSSKVAAVNGRAGKKSARS